MANYKFNPNMITSVRASQAKKKKEAEEKNKYTPEKTQTASAALLQNKGPVNVPIKQTTKQTTKTTSNAPYRQQPKNFTDTVPDYSETKRRLERQAREQIKRERENRFAGQRISASRYANSPFVKRQQPEKNKTEIRQAEKERLKQFTARKAEAKRRQEEADRLFRQSLPQNVQNHFLPQWQKDRLSYKERPLYGLNPVADFVAATDDIAEKATSQKWHRAEREKQLKEQSEQFRQSAKSGEKGADSLTFNPKLIDTNKQYDALSIMLGLEKEKQKPLLTGSAGMINGDEIRIMRSDKGGFQLGNGKPVPISSFLTEEELYAYYFLYGSAGETEAKKYLDNVRLSVIKKAEDIQQAEEYKKFGKENPLASLPTNTLLAGGAALEGLQNTVSRLQGKELSDSDFSFQQNINDIHAGRTDGRGDVSKLFLDVLNGIAVNTPEMITKLIPVYGRALSDLTAVSQTTNRILEEKNQVGLANDNRALITAVSTGILDAMGWEFMPKGASKLIGKVFNKLPQSALKEFMTNLMSYSLGMTGASITQNTLETALDTIFFSKEGKDRFSLTKQSYIEDGKSEDEATSAALRDIVKMFATSGIAASVMGGFTGAIKGLNSGYKLSAAGRKRAADGYSINYETDFADSFDTESEAYKNAQLLRRRMSKGREITDSMFGSQSLLNRAELAKQKERINRWQKISGVKIEEDTVDDVANAEYSGGRIKVSETPDEDRLRVIQHDLTHAAQEGGSADYDAYHTLLESKGGFDEAVRAKKAEYEALGRKIQDSDIEREVAADFAKSLKYTDADLDRLTRAAEGNTTAADKIYNGLRDLSARLKAKKSKYYTDPETGITLSLSEIDNAKRLLFNALTSINETDPDDSTPLFSLKKNLDSRKYGINIDRNLTELAQSSQMNKKLWSIEQKTAVKDKIRQAFDLFKNGETQEGEAKLRQAGLMFNSARKTPEAPDAFVNKFKRLYSQGETYLRTQGSDNISLDDKRKYNIRVDSYTRSLEHSNDIDTFSYGDTHAKNVSDIRSAFEILRSGSEGAREQARSLLLPFAYRIAEDARERNPMYLEGDSDVIKSIRNLKINLEEFRNSPDSNMRQLYDDLKFVVTNTKRASDGIDKAYKDLTESFPQYFGKAANPADQLGEIRDVYNRIRNNEYTARYQPEQIDSAAHSIADEIIHDYYMQQKARKATPQKRANSFINRYGADIEKPLREIGIEDITEGEVQGMGNVIRQTLEEIAGIIKNPDDEPDIEAYTALANRMDRVILEITKGKNRSSDDLLLMTNAMYSGICDLADGYIARKKLEAQDKLTRATINGEDTSTYKRTIESCDLAGEMFRERILSKVYSNTAQKDWITPALKSELDKNKGSFEYDRIRNKDAYAQAAERVKNNDVLSLYEELITKDAAWDAVDTVSAQLLIQRLSNTGRTKQAVSLFEFAQKKTTEAGQMTQAWALAGRLTPEGRLMAFEKKYNKLQGEQIDKIDPTGEKRRLWREAQELDNEAYHKAENYLENGDNEDFHNLRKQAEAKDKKILDGERKVSDTDFENEKLTNEIADLETKLKAKTEEKQKILSEHSAVGTGVPDGPQKRLTKLDAEIETIEAQLKEARIKRTEVWNTYQRALKALGADKKELRGINKEIDTIIRKTANLLENGDEDIDALSHLEDFYNSHHFQFIKREDFEKWRDRLLDIEEITTSEEAVDAIMLNAKMRKMPHGKATRKILQAEFKNVDVEVLKNIALQQVYGAMNDKVPTKFGRILSTVMAGAQLLNPRTIIRNVAGNTLFDLVDGLITHNLAAFVDLLLVPFTKQRSVFVELPHGFINGFKRGGLSYLETALGVDLINRDGTTNARIGVQNYRQRTFKGNRFISAPERLLSYSLTAPDEFQKGIIEARLRRSIELMEKWGWKDFEIEKMIDEELKYRTFQDESLIARTLEGAKKALNHIGTEDFGLGNFLTNYTTVPGNIVTRALEYSPLGTLKAIADIATITKKNVKHKMKLSPLEQRKIVLELTRPITGGGLIWAGWWLRKNGIVVSRPENAEDDFSEKEFYNTVNLDNFQLNLSALKRFVDGEGEESTIQPQEGDELYDLSFITGINSGLQIGSYLAENISGDLAGYEKAAYLLAGTGKAAMNQLTGLSMWMSINSIVNNWKYTDSFYQFVAAEGTDLIMSFYPSVLRQLGNTLDTYVRYPYKGETFGETMKYKFYSKLPFMSLRNEVPVRVDAFGERQSDTLGSVGKDIVQNFINPGYIDIYNEHPVTNELERLSSYSTKILPTSPYSNQNVTIDGQKYSFTLSGKEYEQYSAMLGKLMSRAYINFGMDPDYKLLSDDMRVEKFEEIKKEIEKAAATAWISSSLGIDDSEITKQAEEVADSFKSAAGTYIKIRQAEDYLKTEEVPVETIAQSAYIMREYTDEETAEAIKDEKAKIARIKNGTQYRYETQADGSRKKVKSYQWTAKEREVAIEQAEKNIKKLENGERQKKQYISGRWYSLTDEEREKVSYYIEKYIDEIELPESATAVKPDMSGESSLTTDSVIDVTKPISEKQRDMALIDLGWKAPSPDEMGRADGGKAAESYNKTKSHTAGYKKWSNYHKKSKGRRRSYSGGGGGVKLYSGTKRYRAAIEYRDGVFRNRFKNRRERINPFRRKTKNSRRRFEPASHHRRNPFT